MFCFSFQVLIVSKIYRNLHRFFFDGSGGSNAASIASSKTFFNPFWNAIKETIIEETTGATETNFTCVSAEHSTYLTAFNSLANFSPCSIVMGFCLFFANFSKVPLSSRRSICVPTRRNGVFWQWWVISGTHCNYKASILNERKLHYQKLLLYLFFNVFERTGANDRKTYQKYVCLWVRQRPETIVVLLTYSHLKLRFKALFAKLYFLENKYLLCRKALVCKVLLQS